MRKKIALMMLLLCMMVSFMPAKAFAAVVWKGDGTVDAPYLIETVEHLEATYGYKAYFKLEKDLDLKNVPFDTLYLLSGTNFDGNNKTIKNITMKGSFDNLGFFGVLDKTVVKNLTLENVSITNSKATATNTGVLASQINNGSSIENCRIINGRVTGSSNVGAVAGVINSSTVSKIYSDVAVYFLDTATTGNGITGGLFGYADTSTIKESMSIGTIKNLSATPYMGGLIAFSRNTIVQDSYYNGKIINDVKNNLVNTSGLIGLFNDGYPTRNNDIKNSYSVVELIEGSKINKGLANSAITNSYFNSETSNITVPIDNARTTNQMKKPATYIGWDFENIWEMNGQAYPTLKNLKSTAQQPSTSGAALSILLFVPEAAQLMVSDNSTDNINFTWSSSDNNIVLVDATGKVTAKGVGSATITAENTTLNFNEKIMITVSGDSEGAYRLSAYVAKGGKIRLIAKSTGPITYTSMDPSVATVSDTGEVTGVSKGLALVKAEHDGITEVIYIRVLE